MRWLLDMGVSGIVGEWLREQGFDAIHLKDQGLECLSDHEIFAKARRERRIILTFDLDFGEIASASDAAQPSVVILRLANARAEHVIIRLMRVIADTSESLNEGCVVSVEETRLRVRRMPM